ncbi:MAG: hypothetical protein Q9199_004644 [Rusavskia elegans]
MAPSAFSPEYLQQDKGPLLVRIIWVFEALALTAVCLKVWTRVKVLHQSGLEDVFVLLSDVLSLVYGALLTVSVHYGLGRHAAAIVPTARKAIKLYVAAIPFGMLSVTLPTLAIAIILHQTTDPSPQQLRFLYGIPMLNLVIRIVNVILVFTSCLPDKPQALHGVSKCVNYVVAIHYMYFATCFSAATGVFLTVWPIVAFWKLRLATRKKVILLLLFSTTAIAAVCTLVRVGYLPKIHNFDDFTYSSIDYTIWVVIEGDVIIIAACVPGLRPFVKHLRQKYQTNQRQIPNTPQPPKKSNRNSEITVPASSVSLPRTEPPPAGSISHSEQTLATRRVSKERMVEPDPPKTEDVEKQTFTTIRDGVAQKIPDGTLKSRRLLQ